MTLASHENLTGNLAGGVEECLSDDDLGIEDDDEFQKKKAVHDKKKRQAEKVRPQVSGIRRRHWKPTAIRDNAAIGIPTLSRPR